MKAGTQSSGSNLKRNLLVCDYFLVSTYLLVIHSLLSIYTHHNKIAIKHLKFLSRGITRRSSEPFTRNSASSLVLSNRLHHLILYCIEFFIDQHYTYSPPSRCISIGFRALVSSFRLNILREILFANHFIDLFILIHQ